MRIPFFCSFRVLSRWVQFVPSHTRVPGEIWVYAGYNEFIFSRWCLGPLQTLTALTLLPAKGSMDIHRVASFTSATTRTAEALFCRAASHGACSHLTGIAKCIQEEALAADTRTVWSVDTPRACCKHMCASESVCGLSDGCMDAWMLTAIPFITGGSLRHLASLRRRIEKGVSWVLCGKWDAPDFLGCVETGY